MEYLDEILKIGYFIIAVLSFIVLANAIRSWIKVKKEQNDLKNFEINISNESTSTDIIKILDGYIANIVQDYILLNRSAFANNYINSTEEIKIMKEISTLVARRFSPALYQRLRLYYNDNAISDVIGEKTYIQMSAYVAQNNSVKNKDTK